MSKSLLPDEAAARALCDEIVTRAAALMAQEAGAPVEMILDRFVTYAGAQTVVTFGKADAVELFDQARKAVEAGAFDHLLVANTVN